MRAYERLLKYVAVNTRSDDSSSTVPTTKIQFDLANILADELRALGCENVRCDDKCYVYAEIPATKGYEDRINLGFIAHMDTSPDFCGEGVKPQIIENYDGGEVKLGESGRVLSPEMFPHLPKLKGRTLITTDGTTLLGADDKAGVSEIMTLVERLQSGEIAHGRILIGFTPDVVTGVWVGNDDNSKMGELTGGTVPAKIWRDIMLVATEPYGNSDFEYPEIILNPFKASSVSVIPQSEALKAWEEQDKKEAEKLEKEAEKELKKLEKDAKKFQKEIQQQVQQQMENNPIKPDSIKPSEVLEQTLTPIKKKEVKTIEVKDNQKSEKQEPTTDLFAPVPTFTPIN